MFFSGNGDSSVDVAMEPYFYLLMDALVLLYRLNTFWIALSTAPTEIKLMLVPKGK